MGLDYLTMESEEVRTLFSDLKHAEKGLQTAESNYIPSIHSERYLTGEEVCEYLHLSPRTLQTLRDQREIPFTVISGRIFLYPETGIREVLMKNYRPRGEPF